MPTRITVTRSLTVPVLLDVNDPEFAHWYELGVFWALYGDEQGKGPYEDRYLIDNISRNIQAGRYDRFPSPWLSSAGFYFGVLHGGYLVRPSDTLVVLIDPDFTAGYRQGYQHEQLLNADTLMRTIHQWALKRLNGPALACELGALTCTLAQEHIPAMLQTA